MFEKFVVDVLAQASKNEDIQAFVGQLKDDLIKDTLQALIPLIPKFVDAGFKELAELIPDFNLPDGVDIAKGVTEKVLATDPDLPILSDIFDVSEFLRGLIR